MRDTTARSLLTQLGTAVGMPDLALNAHGECYLLIDGHYLIQIVHHPRDCILMSCALDMHAPDAQQLRTMLQANYGQTAGGIVLALGPDGKFCVQLALPCASAQVADLLEQLEALILEAERWHTHFTHTESTTSLSGTHRALLAQTV